MESRHFESQTAPLLTPEPPLTLPHFEKSGYAPGKLETWSFVCKYNGEAGGTHVEHGWDSLIFTRAPICSVVTLTIKFLIYLLIHLIIILELTSGWPRITQFDFWLTLDAPCITFDPSGALHSSQGFFQLNLVATGHS